ncbi:MAG: M48 family metalloprotease [Pseudobdellovibrio sp.]
MSLAKKLILALLVLMTYPVLASDAICSDLYTGSCDPGVMDDGTGVTLLADNSVKPSPQVIATQVQNFFNANKSLLRRQAYDILKLSCKAGVNPQDVENSNACDAEISQRLLQLVSAREEKGSNGVYVAEELSFMESTGFLNLINTVQFGAQMTTDIESEEAKAARLFPQVKEALIQKIESTNIDPSKKRLLEDRLRRVEFAGSNCGDTFEGLAPNYLPKAFFDGGNKFYMCRNLLNTMTSEFSLVAVMAHEIAHSIGPCNLRTSDSQNFGSPVAKNLQEADRQFVFGDLVRCLRSSSSVHAVNLKALQNDQAPHAAIDYCSDYDDQIEESASDWFASEVLTDIMSKNHPELTRDQWRTGMRNTFRVKCDQTDIEVAFDTHPAVRDRFNAMILPNAKIREKMGCSSVPSPKVQCSMQGAVTPGSSSGSGTGSGVSTGTGTSTSPANRPSENRSQNQGTSR